MGNALRCLESCAAERLNWEHNNTETWQSGGGGPDSSHFYSSSSPTSVLRDDHGAGVHRRGCGSLSEHAGRRFLLRWQVGFAHGAQQRRYQQHHHPRLHLSSPLVTFPLKRRGGGWDGSLLPACLLLFVACNKSLLIFQLQSKTQGRGDKRGAYWNQDRKLKSCYQNIHAGYSNKLDWALAANCP